MKILDLYKYHIFVFSLWIICFTVLGYFYLDINTSWDPDTFWHIKLGQEMINSGHIVRNALNGFDPSLPFISHEYGFELIVGFLYNLAGFQGLHIMTIICMAILVWGLYKLASVSRQEVGIFDFHPLLHLVIFLIVIIIYESFIKIRPQLISMDLILWFFIWCREFQKKPTYRTIAILFLISLAISNLHGGVFPILIVLWAIILFESIVLTMSTPKHLLATFLIVIGGFINSGGFKNVTYILQANKNHFSDYISEWMPVNFRSNIVFLLFLILFLWSFKKSIHNTIFRTCFAFALLFLGVASTKSYLFLLLFLPYEFALAIETVPKVEFMKNINYINKASFAFPLYGIILFTFLIKGFTSELKVPESYYPVSESKFILEQWHNTEKPKVLATYDVGGYLMSKDMKVLCDGRFDPFIQDQSKGYRNKTAYERCLGASENSDDLLEEITYDQPDFVIIKGPDMDTAARERLIKIWGSPDYKGTYGVVWIMNPKRINP